MLGFKSIDIILLYIFSIIISQGLAAEKCTPHPPCKCDYEDGNVIDLNPLAAGNFIEGKIGDYTYYFHPCTNKNLVIPGLPANAVQNCADGTSLCLLNNADNTTQNLGKIEDSQLVPSVTEPGIYDILFNDKKNNKTTAINLVCSHIQENILHIDLLAKYPKHHLLFLSRHACPYMAYHGLSTGSVLVIIFLVFTGIYLLGGAAILHFLRGAQGKEMIPNIDFWTDLPLLCRDGVIFLQNGCKPPQQPGETYDRI